MWHSVADPQAHLVLELVAYAVGAQVYWRGARSLPQPEPGNRMLILGAAVLGAMVGSKLLHMLEHLPHFFQQNDMALWLGGKSLLGGLLGGTLGVEIAKKLTGWVHPTGDPWVPALSVGIIIGRLGCQLSGLWDQTYGAPTSLPWGWDYGDGIPRHPTALYEMILVAMACTAARRPRILQKPGASFALFLICYCAMRFLLEWLKPPFRDDSAGDLPVALYCNLTAIQWAALLGVGWYCMIFSRRSRIPGSA